MGINIRTKGQEGEREVARALNSIVHSVLEKHGIPIPEKPVIQRNQNQSAVGGSDLSNPFGVAIEVKRQEQLSINTWWRQCIASALDSDGIPVLLFRQNGRRDWRCILLVDVPLAEGLHVTQIRAEIEWGDFLQWFYRRVDRMLTMAEWVPPTG